MFRRLETDTAARAVTIFVEGEPFAARATDTVAAALIAAGLERFRATPVSGAPRAAYCMMGVCFDCLVTIDGTANRQACSIRVREGMKIGMQRGKREYGT
jgi:hypothetical protein